MSGKKRRSHVVNRRCAMVREGGQACRGIPARGETFCHAHRRYREAARTTVVTVPLMDDEASIVFVRSQTVRALATGSLPPANGREMLHGCRDAEQRLDKKLHLQIAAMRYAALAERMGAEKLRGYMREFLELVETQRQEPDVEEREIEVESQETAEERQEGAAERVEEGPQETLHHSVFPEVKEQWERSQRRTEGEILKLVAPVEGESWTEAIARREARDAAIAAAV